MAEQSLDLHGSPWLTAPAAEATAGRETEAPPLMTTPDRSARPLGPVYRAASVSLGRGAWTDGAEGFREHRRRGGHSVRNFRDKVGGRPVNMLWTEKPLGMGRLRERKWLQPMTLDLAEGGRAVCVPIRR